MGSPLRGELARGEPGVKKAPLSNPRFIAAGLAIVVAWRTKSVAAVIVVGMVVVWALQALT